MNHNLKSLRDLKKNRIKQLGVLKMNLKKARKIVIVLVFVIDTVVMKSTIQKVLNIVCVLNFQPWSFTRIEADLNYLVRDEPMSGGGGAPPGGRGGGK
jgi:uncharacterized membrane protein